MVVKRRLWGTAVAAMADGKVGLGEIKKWGLA